ncbi:MAG: type II secretion system protein [Oligosphaeraceae bacterium]|nr:type II secretion system protein [Oligosphaeraceae bacterium]
MAMRRTYTLIEMLVVILILGLVSAVALPRFLRIPRKISTERTLSEIRQVFAESSARARATGQALNLTLDPETSLLTVSASSDSLSQEWRPPMPKVEDSNSRTPIFISAKDTYTLSDSIEWQAEPENYNSEGRIVFSFFPDGQASGPQLYFSSHNSRFRLVVDNITARANIYAED